MSDSLTLFGPIEDADDALAALSAGSSKPVPGPFAAVAIERSIDRSLDYAIPGRLKGAILVGQRVKVPLGRKNKPHYGYVTAIRETSDFRDPSKIKSLLAVDDTRVLVPPTLMSLAQWMSRYYITPLGQVLECIIPSAVKKRTGIGYLTMVRLAVPIADAQALLEKTKAVKRRAIIARLLQLEPGHSIELLRLATESGVKPTTVRNLAKLGLIALQSVVDLPGLSADAAAPAPRQADMALNVDQQRVLDDVSPRLVTPPGAAEDATPGFSVNLLLGVTGSGKTEVYLQCLRQVVDQGRQAIVLVPEIALTPQTVRRFTARFDRVAILHSGLSQTQRHKFWQQIATGAAQVVVGARSAVFAPTPNLGVIVVDEEHESSYKQDEAPRYHGRDVAIKRAQLQNIPIILGSATPSLEMYSKVAGDEATKRRSDEASEGTDARAANRPAATPMGSISPSPNPFVAPSLRRSVASPYHLLSLPNRVRNLQLPHVELIDMKQERKLRPGVNLLGQRLEYLLGNTIAQGQQAILLLNRRGYSNFVHCASCQEAIGCKYCDKTMTYHRSAGEHELTAKIAPSSHAGQLHCHYCLAVNVLPTACPHCGKSLSLFGLGTQRVEEEIKRKFPQITFARVDSDTMRSSKDYEALLGRFARKEVQVLLGTQMIAKGLDYPNVTLVGVISGDTALALPDFRAAERTFQLITQVAGRAGRGDLPGRVVLQTFLPDDPAIGFAIKQDFVGFARHELANRKQIDLPPYGRMVRIVIRDHEAEHAQELAEVLAAALSQAVADQNGAVTMKGPMPCAVSRISGYFRHQIVLTAKTPAPLQRVLAAVRSQGALNKPERVAVDVDPVSLL